jgi:hypothetical protein
MTKLNAVQAVSFLAAVVAVLIDPYLLVNVTVGLAAGLLLGRIVRGKRMVTFLRAARGLIRP